MMLLLPYEGIGLNKKSTFGEKLRGPTHRGNFFFFFSGHHYR